MHEMSFMVGIAVLVEFLLPLVAMFPIINENICKSFQ